MNDEQQLWRDVQKFMNQFPGFITVAKKIGQIGDIESWQAAEQRKLDAITQELEKQRAVITSEREAANSEVERKQVELENQIRAHDQWLVSNKDTAVAMAQTVVTDAKNSAAKIVSYAQDKAREITDGIAMMESKKAELEQQIADLMDVMLATKNEHEATLNTLAATKNQHAAFIKQITGG